MSQFARPDSDINIGSWSPYPADPATLFDKLDEETQNGDTDYIYCDIDEDECEIGLSGVIDPESAVGHVIRCYAQCPGGAGAKEYMTMSLVENGNVRASAGSVLINRLAYTLIEYTLSEAEANSIVNYANLRLRFHINVVSPGEPIRITQAELEVPDVAGEEHSGSGSISGNGSATGTIKKGGLGSALKSAGGTLLALGLAGMLGIASIAGGGAQLGVGEKAVSGAVSVSGSGTQVVSGKKIVSGSLSVSSGGSIVATGVKAEGEAHSGVAVVSGNGGIEAAVIKQALTDLAITGNGSLGGNGIKQAPGDSTIVGGGFLVAVGTMSESHSGVAIISESGVVDGAGIKQAPGSLVIIGGGFIVVTGYGQETFIEVVKTVFLKSKLTERLVELKSTIKPSIVLNSEIKPEGEE